jgi:hypothetical protein
MFMGADLIRELMRMRLRVEMAHSILEHSAGQTMTQPFAGLRVIDWSTVAAGPSAGQLFAVLGAEVIKVLLYQVQKHFR